ncbi:hypothetical protein HYV64_05070 [Candidatus Shapirobacteria bacterium]|nr:hypothetical protein [Candidatus Shapirobacteria bacterium]
MSTKGAVDFLSGISPEDLEVSLPGFQARRAVEVAHKGLSVAQAAKDEGVSVPVMRKTLGWAAANMEKAITEANS